MKEGFCSSMAAGHSCATIELQETDTYPLLMDNSPQSNQDIVLSILPEGSSSLHGNSGIAIDIPEYVPPSTANQAQLTPSTALSGRLGSFRRHANVNTYGARQRASPLNSGLWISIELTITISQIVASIIVLSLSRDEKPRAPLSLWVVGYAAGCLATLPLLYWRYTHHHTQQSENDLSVAAGSPSSAPSLSQTNQQSPEHTSMREGDSQIITEPTVRGNQVSTGAGPRIAVHMERFKIALDCFFAVWFVVGNVWVFGGHSSSHEAPNLYRLCIVFLTFSCIGYAMPFIICATVCCCLPCLITLLGYREDQGQTKGAAPEVIDALPIYKFKTKNSSSEKLCKDGSDSDCDSPGNPGEGGTFAAGTAKERFVSAEDAVCCICLGKYKDGVDLKELPCAHFFHVECVDKWLKINASCPLCKHELGCPVDQQE